MDPKIAKSIVKAGKERGLEVDLRANYSGRGMYGSSAAAVVASGPGEFLAAACWAVADRVNPPSKRPDGPDVGDLIAGAGGARFDSLGRGLIYY